MPQQNFSESLMSRRQESLARGRRRAGADAAVKNHERSFRPEIQGLRALAVLMVVTYHVWMGRVSGGVDVFLFISAFLMTLQFVRKHDRGVRTNLLRHYLHVFWRLLPLAALVILAVLIVGRFLYPATQWGGLLTQAWSSLLYAENWTLKALAVDYYADNHALASPLQHFWSLSIQGQVFILWPLIFLVSSGVARARGIGYRKLLAFVFGAVLLLSLTFSIWYTATSQAEAYFDTFARLWEFALGSLLALGLKHLALPVMVRVVLGWAGVVAMLACGFVIDVQGAFPGVAALWPTLSAAAVIVAGWTGSPFGVDRILSSKPLLSLGGNSYALYLWHWPVLVFALMVRERENADGKLGFAVVVLSLALAYASTWLVEKRLRTWSWPDLRGRNALAACAAVVALVSAPLGYWQLNHNAKVSAPISATERDNPGARTLDPDYVARSSPEAPVMPPAEKVATDWVSLDGPCPEEFKPKGGKEVVERCGFQAPPSGEASKTVMMLGHSHAEQFMAAVKPLAAQENWNLIAQQKGGCAFSPVEATGDKACDEYNRDVWSYVQQVKPDLVITMATQSVPDSPREELSAGFESMAEELEKLGIEVLGIRDNPRSARNLSTCAIAKGDDDPSCSLERSSVVAPEPVYEDEKYGESLGSVKFMDLTDRICTTSACPPKVGNIWVYLDENHLTGTYAASLAPAFEERYGALFGS